MNAMIAVVLPDRIGSYSYTYRRDLYGNYSVDRISLFIILGNNMYNRIYPRPHIYSRYQSQTGTDSYIPVQTWDYFIRNFRNSMELILDIRPDWRNYEIMKKFDCDNPFIYRMP